MIAKPPTSVCQGVFISGLAEARLTTGQLYTLTTRVMNSVPTVPPISVSIFKVETIYVILVDTEICTG
jgi:hypothetical protein